MKFDGAKPTFPPLSPGWYPAMIDDAVDTESKSSGKPMTKVTFKVAAKKKDGSFWFKKIFSYYCWHVERHTKAMAELCNAVGIDPKGDVDATAMNGRKLEVRVAIEVDPSGEYPDKNVAVEYRAAPGYTPAEAAPIAPAMEPEADFPVDDIPF